MGDPTEDMQQASKLPEGDVIRILLEQHARIRTLFTDIHEAIGTARASAFAELRAMLVVHETAEQLVLRPASKKVAGTDVVDARLHEEAEERDEFPAILAGCTAEERQSMGRMLTATENLAPTRPHPATAGSKVATVLTMPLASIVDRTKDAISKVG